MQVEGGYLTSVVPPRPAPLPYPPERVEPDGVYPLP
jgi:hypothetical protein